MRATIASLRRGLRYLILVLSIAALVACAQENNPTAEPPTRTPKPTFTLISTATHTLLPPTPTALPTDTPTPPTLALAPQMTTHTPTIVPSPTHTPPTPTDTPLPPTAAPTTVPTDTPTPTPTASALPTRDPFLNSLNGLRVDDPSRLQKRPIVVRYGNDSAARPHAGISQAEIVFEEIMEAYWITRITAVFWAAEPEAVGPLRSARPVNLSLVPMFDGVFVYSGASIGVNELLAQTDFPKIHEGTRGNGFYRSAQKRAPHNLYTSIAAIRKCLADNGWEKAVTLEGFVFAKEPPQGQPALKVHIPLPQTSTVDYTYDPSTGRYMRFVQEEPYLEELTGQQVGVANVVVLYTEHLKTDIVEDSLGSTSLNIVTLGEGRVQLFRDGVMIEGLWRRAKVTDLFQFVDAQGNSIPLKPGLTWVQFVPPTYELTVVGQ